MKNVCFQMSRKVWLTMLIILSMTIPALAQNITVTGTVYEPDGETAIGVSISQKGAHGVGVTTDIDGNYRISVPSDAVLVVSYVGYETQEVNVDGRTHIDITLSTQSKALEEVVVIGYGVVKKEDATGSVSVIKPDEIEAGLATTAQDMLVGAAPGVVVTTTGNPYGEANIRIRGGSSLSASNDPLIVIDGVPMENGVVKGSSNPLALVSPENIESMTILKDASATAIFGSRASNGVIIITTKKGQSGKPQVNFSANMYVNTARRTLDMMDGNEFRNYIMSRYDAESGQVHALGTANTNWQKEILRTSISSDYNLSVGGTVGFLPYRVAVSYTNNNGVIKTTGMDRATASINLTPKFFDDLLSVNVNLKGAYISNQYEQGTLGGAVSFNPTLPVHSENVFNNWTSYDKSGNIAGPTTPGTDLSDIYSINPVSRLIDYYCKSNVWQSVGNAQFDLKMPFLRELRANLNLGYEYNHGKVNNYNLPHSPEAWKAGHYTQENPDTPIRDGYAGRNFEVQKRYNLLLDFYLNYNKDFKAIDSNLDLTAGYSWQKIVSQGHNWSEVYAPGESFNGFQRDKTSYWSSPYQLVSFFGRAQFNLLSNYLITATVRRDGSSRFSKDHRWGTFPSVALAWRVIGENWMEGARNVMNDFKIRATWGVTGQQDLGSGFDMLFPYLPVYNVYNSVNGEAAPFGNMKTYVLVVPSKFNADLKWEETTTWNAGIDFAFLNNRINGSIDYYYRKTKDLLTTTTYPAGSNLGPDGPMNIGDLTNTGVEFNIVTRPVVTKNFQWTSSLNVAWNKNEITHLAQGADIPTGNIGNEVNVQLQREGAPAFSYYVFEQVYNPDGTPAEGVFVDRNGDGQITDNDKYLFHSRDPKVTMNWSNTFNYKNWDFGFVFRGSFGNWMYNKNMSDNCFGGDAQTLPLGNLLSQDFCYIFHSSKNTNMLGSDYFVQNASFVRCDNITVGYTWPQLLNNALRLRLFGAVQNPFVITKYKGNDPEVFSGIDSNVYPRPTTVSVGLVATF